MILWGTALVVLLGAPVLLALIYRKGKKGHVLGIRQGYKRDVRYFGRSFANMIEKAIPDMKDGKIQLSREEDVIEVGEGHKFHTQEIEKIVLVRGTDFTPIENNLKFKKEIYCAEDAYLTMNNLKLRALYSKKRIAVGSGTEIVRWLDAEEAVVVGDHCNMGISTTSGEMLIMGFDNVFNRLFAPVIKIGRRVNEVKVDEDSNDNRIFRLPVKTDVKHNIRYVNEDMASEDGLVPYSVFAKHDINIAEDIILQGSIHSDGSVRIMKNAVVLGNVFAEGEVLLDNNARVLGNIFTQGSVIFEEGAIVGQPHKISSVIAREKIRFYGENTVYGFVSAGTAGEILSDSDLQEKPVTYNFPEKNTQMKNIVFQGLEEYRNVDLQGFRLDNSIKSAEIPAGADIIPKSQFFGCAEIEKVCFPESISVIDDYAFADCRKMVLSKNLGDINVTYIGISAFENCENLEIQKFPETLRVMEGAAFANCTSLKKVIFSKTALLKKVGDHSFRGCMNLEEVYLPDQTEYIGVSAFRECDSLKRISVPEMVKEQPGIIEILENNIKVAVEFRKIENTSIEKESEDNE